MQKNENNARVEQMMSEMQRLIDTEKSTETQIIYDHQGNRLAPDGRKLGDLSAISR